MKKIFILTGEPSGDKLASEVITNIKKNNANIEYLCVGGEFLQSLGIKSIFDQKEITFMAFTDILLNFFKIKRKINLTVKKILEFNPDILFSVDSPDFSLRVCNLIKKKNPNIKTIHFIAPKVWAWRQGRVKQMKKFIDHILLLFKFEKSYFDNESLTNTFVGHPLLDKIKEKKVDISNFLNKKNVISIFPGSRLSEIKFHTPILINFIKKMNNRNNNLNYIFHTNHIYKNYLTSFLQKENISNVEIISDDKIKSEVIKNSIFAVVKSGTVSLEVCKHGVPSIIIYKMNFINFYIAKLFLKIKYANMINIINNKEILPELIQKDCNSDEIFKTVNFFLKKPDLMREQISQVKKTIDDLTSESSSSNEASKVLLSYLT